MRYVGNPTAVAWPSDGVCAWTTNTAVKGFSDGVRKYNYTDGSVKNACYIAASDWTIGYNGGVTTVFEFPFVAVWSREHTEDAVASLSANPYQILKRRIAKTYFIPPAAAESSVFVIPRNSSPLRKPQGEVTLNPQHPYAKHALGVWLLRGDSDYNLSRRGVWDFPFIRKATTSGADAREGVYADATGALSYLEAPEGYGYSSAPLRNNMTYTISARIRMSAWEDWGSLFTFGQVATNGYINIQRYSSGDYFRITHNKTASGIFTSGVGAPSKFTDGEWHTLTLRFTGGTLWLYKDGVLLESKTMSTYPASTTQGSNAIRLMLYSWADVDALWLRCHGWCHQHYYPPRWP